MKARRIAAQELSEAARLAEDTSSPSLLGHEHTRYRSVAALLNYYAMDRPDVMYQTKECMRCMASPTLQDEINLKRIIRYLMAVPRRPMHYPWRPLDSDIEVFVDSDFAGCVRTRKSTLGGTVL